MPAGVYGVTQENQEQAGIHRVTETLDAGQERRIHGSSAVITGLEIPGAE